jgi:hypothetical protein
MTAGKSGGGEPNTSGSVGLGVRVRWGEPEFLGSKLLGGLGRQHDTNRDKHRPHGNHRDAAGTGDSPPSPTHASAPRDSR